MGLTIGADETVNVPYDIGGHRSTEWRTRPRRISMLGLASRARSLGRRDRETRSRARRP
jgi:hypothetical protein